MKTKKRKPTVFLNNGQYFCGGSAITEAQAKAIFDDVGSAEYSQAAFAALAKLALAEGKVAIPQIIP